LGLADSVRFRRSPPGKFRVEAEAEGTGMVIFTADELEGVAVADDVVVEVRATLVAAPR